MSNTSIATENSRIFEVIMLRTKNQTSLATYQESTSYVEPKLQYCKSGLTSSDYKYYHLYLLANYPIKHGDWYAMTGDYRYGVTQCTVEDDLCNEERTQKVVATTDASLGLPLIDQSLVKEYAASGGEIKHVYVKTNSPVCKCDTLERAFACPFSCGDDCKAPNPNNDFYGLMPSVGTDNTITILPHRMLMCCVKMVPTKETKGQTFSDDDLVLITSKPPTNVNKLCFFSEYKPHSIFGSLSPNVTKQYLYLTSERRIKEKITLDKDGDWYWNSKYNFVSNIGDITEFDFKVEATTNPELGLPLIPRPITDRYVSHGVATAMIEMNAGSGDERLTAKTDSGNFVTILK